MRVRRVDSEPISGDYRAQHAIESSERSLAGKQYIAIFALVIGLGIIGSLFQEDDSSEVSSVAADTALGETAVIDEQASAPTAPAPVVEATVAPTTTTTSTTTTTEAPTTTQPVVVDFADRELNRVDDVLGNISPKSVVAVGNGLFFAQNMMYQHSITVYDEQGSLVRTIDDQVDLAAFGIADGVVARGAPVEAAPTSNGEHVYVSNYAMYGPGFGPEPGDGCNDTGWDNSFLYRVRTTDLEIDEVIEVGAVPKFLAVTPDDRLVVVANWCSFDVSVVDTASGVEVARIDIGRHPRGIAISGDSSTAYVTEQGGSRIAIIPLDEIRSPNDRLGAQEFAASHNGVELDWIEDVGTGPRSIVLSPDERYLYATLNRDGEVVKIDLETREVVAEVRTGEAPRSMAMSEDGEVLYVVNYNSNTMSRVLTETMEEVQEVDTADKPIGITVDPASSNVWVSNYSGVLQIYEDVAN